MWHSFYPLSHKGYLYLKRACWSSLKHTGLSLPKSVCFSLQLLLPRLRVGLFKCWMELELNSLRPNIQAFSVRLIRFGVPPIDAFGKCIWAHKEMKTWHSVLVFDSHFCYRLPSNTHTATVEFSDAKLHLWLTGSDVICLWQFISQFVNDIDRDSATGWAVLIDLQTIAVRYLTRLSCFFASLA